MSWKFRKVTFLNYEPCTWHDSMTTQAGLPSSVRNDSQSCWARVFLKVKKMHKNAQSVFFCFFCVNSALVTSSVGPRILPALKSSAPTESSSPSPKSKIISGLSGSGRVIGLLTSAFAVTTVLYYTTLYYTILYYTIPWHTVLYYTIPWHTVLYYTILYCTILYLS